MHLSDVIDGVDGTSWDRKTKTSEDAQEINCFKLVDDGMVTTRYCVTAAMID